MVAEKGIRRNPKWWTPHTDLGAASSVPRCNELSLTRAVLCCVAAAGGGSYAAWHHRLWVLDQGESDLQQELRLCSLMLNMDHRNCQPPANTTQRNSQPRSSPDSSRRSVLTLPTPLCPLTVPLPPFLPLQFSVGIIVEP